MNELAYPSVVLRVVIMLDRMSMIVNVIATQIAANNMPSRGDCAIRVKTDVP